MTETKSSPPNILIVDDTPANVLLLVKMLTRQGYQTKAVLSGKLALEAARQEQPDLILLDINMPEMNGYELCEQLKADALLHDIPVIFISASNETIDKVRAFRVGGVDYLSKPFHLEEAHARVEAHLRIRSLQRQLGDQNETLERLVTKRTHELANAYERCRELGRLKDDFLRMISHEMRTPANGVLGVGALLLELCPPSRDRTLYESLFAQSSLRLHNLIEDATMIAEMEQLTRGSGATVSFAELAAEAGTSLPGIRLSLELSTAAGMFLPKGDHPLLRKAMESMILLTTSLSRDKQITRMTGIVEEETLRVRLEVDALSLSAEQAAGFFEIESQARSASYAESLGLAPVVAHRIISAFGGTLRLVKGEGDNGYVEALLLDERLSA